MFRRTFLAAASGLTALFVPGQAAAATQAGMPQAGPKRHAQDDWLDKAPTGHRVIFDTWMSLPGAGVNVIARGSPMGPADIENTGRILAAQGL